MDSTQCTVKLKLPRAQNFGSDEKELFLSLIEKNLDVLECKKSDNLTRQRKDKCWEQMTSEFNSASMTQKRSKEQLFTLWRNLKTKAKLYVEKQPSWLTTDAPSLIEASNERFYEKVRDITRAQIDTDINLSDDSSTWDTGATPDITGDSVATAQEIWVATGDSSTPVKEPTSPSQGKVSPNWTVQIDGGRKRKPKHTRTENFVHDEKVLLVSILEPNIKIVEKKKIDSISLRERDECWNKIEKQFNSATKGRKRTKKQLFNLWKNIKNRAKRDYAEKRLVRVETGKPPLILSSDPVDDRVYEIFENQVNSSENQPDEAVPRAESPVHIGSDCGDKVKEVSVAAGDASTPVEKPTAAALPGSTAANLSIQINGINSDAAGKTLLSLAKSEHDIRMGILKAEHKAKMNVIETKIALLKRKGEREEAIFVKKMKLLDSQLQDNC